MDSLTQLVLGAAVGEAVLGRQAGRKAAIIGGIVATLPDLDVFIRHSSDVADFTFHRSWSHSWFTALVATPLIVFVLSKLFSRISFKDGRWHLIVLLALVTHSLLDCFTIYGTQILWPLTNAPVSWGTIFIVDPVYTLPLLIGVICALIMRNNKGTRFNTIGLVLSTTYLAWTVYAQAHVGRLARDSLTARNISVPLVKATPAPFNTLLWRVIAIDKNNYYIGYRSLITDKQPIKFSKFETYPEWLQPIAGHWPVQRLTWFTNGFYSVTREKDNLLLTDLRMGMEGAYIFRFIVGAYKNDAIAPLPGKRMSQPRDMSRLHDIWSRIWDENIQLEP